MLLSPHQIAQTREHALNNLYMDPFSYASTLIFDVEVRLLTYIRPLTAAPS